MQSVHDTSVRKWRGVRDDFILCYLVTRQPVTLFINKCYIGVPSLPNLCYIVYNTALKGSIHKLKCGESNRDDAPAGHTVSACDLYQPG
jgi:hypothetical protein